MVVLVLLPVLLPVLALVLMLAALEVDKGSTIRLCSLSTSTLPLPTPLPPKMGRGSPVVVQRLVSP